MATHLDLEEQEQLDQLKHFWKRYGNAITWVLIVVLAAFAGWNGWQWWQRNEAIKAGTIFEELERASQANDAAKVLTIFGTLKERHPKTVYAEQGGLLAAKAQADSGKLDDARGTLAWVADNATETEYRTMARLRLAAVLLEQKKPDDALKQLDAANSPAFEALVADRRGDVLLAQNKKDDAKAAYQRAYATMDPKVDYRRLIEAKLIALGATPPSPAASAASGATK